MTESSAVRANGDISAAGVPMKITASGHAVAKNIINGRAKPKMRFVQARPNLFAGKIEGGQGDSHSEPRKEDAEETQLIDREKLDCAKIDASDEISTHSKIEGVPAGVTPKDWAARYKKILKLKKHLSFSIFLVDWFLNPE